MDKKNIVYSTKKVYLCEKVIFMKTYKLSELLEIKNGKDHKHLIDGAYPVYEIVGENQTRLGYRIDFV